MRRIVKKLKKVGKRTVKTAKDAAKTTTKTAGRVAKHTTKVRKPVKKAAKRVVKPARKVVKRSATAAGRSTNTGTRSRTRIPARRGQKNSDGWGRDHSDSKWTTIQIRPASRLPGLDDYDRKAHAYRTSYIRPPRYKIGVGACNALKSLDGKVVDEVLDELDRERHPNPGPDSDPQHPREPGSRVELPDQLRIPKEIVAWNWNIQKRDGKIVSKVRRAASIGTGACGAMLTVPGPGEYRVNLTLETKKNKQTASRKFRIRDRLIVSLGDSYASGEGNPDSPSSVPVNLNKRQKAANAASLNLAHRTKPEWLEPGAHRSLLSGPALAADACENTYDGDLVTFLSFASTGATIHSGLLGPQYKWQRTGQVKEARKAVGKRKIDVLLLSIGGNDVGFSKGLVQLLIDIQANRHKTIRQTTEKIRELGKKWLPELAEQVKALEADHVLITEYPIAHFDRKDDGTAGKGCGLFDLGKIMKYLPPFKIPAYILRFWGQDFLKITKKEAEAVKKLGTLLNQEIEAAAKENGWTFVSGIADGFRGHGYCRDSNDRYFVSFLNSLQRQRNYLGTMHPNIKGQHVYADQIAEVLKQGVFRPRPKSRDHRK